LNLETGTGGTSGSASRTGDCGRKGKAGSGETSGTGGSVKGSSFFENEVMTFFLFFSVKK